jgi:hypothetical protein
MDRTHLPPFGHPLEKTEFDETPKKSLSEIWVKRNSSEGVGRMAGGCLTV